MAWAFHGPEHVPHARRGLGVLVAAALLSTGCYRHGYIYPEQLPELSGVPPGKRTFIEKDPRGAGTGGAPAAPAEGGTTTSRYRSIAFDEVVVTLMDGRRLELVPPFESSIWPHAYGRVVTIDNGAGPQSYWLSEVASVEIATYNPTRAAIIVTATGIGAALGLVLDIVWIFNNDDAPRDADQPLPPEPGGPPGPLPVFTLLGAGIGLALSIPMTSDL